MKEAIMGLDGGGSNLRILVVDRETEQELYSRDITTGTNLSTVADKKEALTNIRNLIVSGFKGIPQDYCIKGIGLSSAGTEIPENRVMLEEVLNSAVKQVQKTSAVALAFPPKCFITNDIDILLHSADIALVAGTGTVGAVKYLDVEPYDNAETPPDDYTIHKFDGNGQFIGDKGSGYWISKEILTRVAEIENLGGYMNRKGEFVECDPRDSELLKMVYERVFEAKGVSREEAKKLLREKKVPEFVALVYSATADNGNVFDRAKVGNMFGKLAVDAAYAGDEAANDVLEHSAQELFKNIAAGYRMGKFDEKEWCNILLSGSVLVKNDIVRWHLENKIREAYPNVSIKVNNEKPVWSTIRYVDGKIKQKVLKRDEEAIK
ncbi:MAG: hypothetical protein IKJ36_03265 [Clostridia bacterium]|nr:hypothetical protein [Clostridia bacterium]